MLNLIPPVAFWLIVLVVCLVAEGITTQLVSLWFAAGAVGALIAATLQAGMMVQLTVFLLLSIALLLGLRPLLRGVLRTRKDRTNADRILGQNAVVTEAIDNQRGTGQVHLMGQVWTARSVRPEETFREGDTVVVREIAGVKAMVEACETRNGGNLDDSSFSDTAADRGHSCSGEH